MRVGGAGRHVALRSAQRSGAAFALQQASVVVDHQFARGFVRYLPQQGDLRLRSRQHQCAPQPVDAFAVLYLAHSAVASRQHSSSVPLKSSCVASSAVRMPSSSPELRSLAPANAMPERSSGFSLATKDAELEPRRLVISSVNC